MSELLLTRRFVPGFLLTKIGARRSRSLLRRLAPAGKETTKEMQDHVQTTLVEGQSIQ
jgi:hypothetical protein